MSGLDKISAPVKKQIGLIGVEAHIKNNWPNVNAWLTDSTISIPYRDTIFLPDNFHSNHKNEHGNGRKKHVPGFYRFAFCVVIVQLAAIAFIVVSYVVRFKLKLFRLKE
jgi:hypothetical protein